MSVIIHKIKFSFREIRYLHHSSYVTDQKPFQEGGDILEAIQEHCLSEIRHKQNPLQVHYFHERLKHSLAARCPMIFLLDFGNVYLQMCDAAIERGRTAFKYIHFMYRLGVSQLVLSNASKF